MALARERPRERRADQTRRPQPGCSARPRRCEGWRDGRASFAGLPCVAAIVGAVPPRRGVDERTARACAAELLTSYPVSGDRFRAHQLRAPAARHLRSDPRPARRARLRHTSRQSSAARPADGRDVAAAAACDGRAARARVAAIARRRRSRPPSRSPRRDARPLSSASLMRCRGCG